MTRRTAWILLAGAILTIGACTSGADTATTTVLVAASTTTSGTTPDTTSVAEVATTTTLPVNEMDTDPVRTVETMIQAFNDGNIEKFDEVVGKHETSDPRMGYLFGPMYHVQAKVAANGSFELSEPCQLVATSEAEDTDVVCSGIETNEYIEAGGITIPWDMTFRVQDGRVIGGFTPGEYDDEGNLLPEGTSGAEGPYGPSVTYATTVLEWFYATYPNIANALPIDAEPLRTSLAAPHIGTTWPITAWDNGIPLKSSMPTVLEYLDEFVAQSATYPIVQP